MANRLDKHILKNGMVILGEPIDSVQSVAFDFMLPAGAAMLDDGYCGAANVISDWIFRGAGDRDSRQLCDALDGLGLHRMVSAGTSHLTIGSALEADNLAEALNLHADIIRCPKLQPQQFELARQLAVDEVLGLNDDPRRKVMLKLRQKFFPSPWGRSTAGEIAELKKLTADVTKRIIENKFNFSHTIFTIAGKYDFDAVCKQIEQLFETGKQESFEPVKLGSREGKYTHIANDGAQVHIGLATETVKPTDDDYYNARIAVSVLSGGMSARLFTEVREKRGLCYAIGARYHGLKDFAGFMCYAGTTPEKAQQTLDVIIAEFNRLVDGISDDELQRVKVGLKSSLIMQSESTSNRAGAIGSDYYMLGRVRTLDEIKQKIEEITTESVLKFLKRNRFKDFTVVTIGPQQVRV